MVRSLQPFSFFFFFNDTATTEIYTLSLHDALPISAFVCAARSPPARRARLCWSRSEEHTSELQSQSNLVCRLLLEKKNKIKKKLPKRIKQRHVDDRQNDCIIH